MKRLSSRQLYLLIGNNNTGKTTVQKTIIKLLCGIEYEKLRTNKLIQISNICLLKKADNIFLANRSFQEKIKEYKSVSNYFEKYFENADIAILSSHLNISDIEEMILESKKQFYNVTGVFFSNSIENDSQLNSNISALNWDERIVLDNPNTLSQVEVENQLNKISEELSIHIIKKLS